MKKKILSAMTALSLCLALLPAGVLAADSPTVAASVEEVRAYFEAAGYSAGIDASSPNKVNVGSPSAPDPAGITADLHINCDVSIEVVCAVDMGGHYILIGNGAKVAISKSSSGSIMGTGDNEEKAVIALSPQSALTLSSVSVTSTGGSGSCAVKVMPTGRNQEATLTLDGATITADNNNGIGLYLEGAAETTISGGTVSGATGIKIKSGTLNIGGSSPSVCGHGPYQKAAAGIISDGSAILIESSGIVQVTLGPDAALSSAHSYAICEFGKSASKINIDSTAEWTYDTGLPSPVQVKNPENVTVSQNGDAWKNAPRQPQTLTAGGNSTADRVDYQEAYQKAGLTLGKAAADGEKQYYPLTIDKLKLQKLSTDDPDLYQKLKDPDDSSKLRFYMDYTAPRVQSGAIAEAVVAYNNSYSNMPLNNAAKNGFYHYIAIGSTTTPVTYTALIRWMDKDGRVLAVTEVNVEITTLPTHTVTFNSDGGSNVASVEVTEGQTVAKPADPTRTGFEFGRWVRADNGSPWNFETATVTENITLKATWLQTRTVDFDCQGGTPEPPPQSIVDGGKVTKPDDPTKDGFKFDGWYTDKNCETPPWDFDRHVVNGGITLYAKWLKDPTVTFNYQDEGATADKTVTIDYGGTVEKPDDPGEREGYQFQGWCKDKDCTEAWNFDTTVTEDLTLYAKWEKLPATCTVTFDGHGGTFKVENEADKQSIEVTVFEGKTVTPPAAPIRDGYKFDGWYKDDTFAEAWNFDKDVVEGDLTLHAKWLAAYTVTFETDGGSEVAAQTVVQGETAEEPEKPTKTGYNFIDWYAENAETAWNFATVITGDLTLYARWEERPPEIYTVTFDSQGGSPTPSPKSVTEGEKVVEPEETPVKEGYTFGGWYQEQACTNVWNFANDKVTASLTLYAKWTKTETPAPQQCTVTFNSQGGSAVASLQVDKDTAVSKPADPTRSGYTFGGWFKESSCTTAWSFSSPVTENLTLYAKWTQIENNRTSYSITVRSDIRYGEVRVSHSRAEQGTRVSITVEPDSDSRLSWVEVEKENGSLLSLDGSGSRYTFTMPACDVTVDAGFTLQHIYTGSAAILTTPPVQTAPAPVFTPVTQRSVPSFRDIPGDSWAAASARWAYQNGYLDMASDGSFRLDGPVSHQQMWKIMARWLNAPASNERDVNDWAYQSGAAKSGSPHSSMTRQDVVIYLYKCYFLMGGDVSAKGNLAAYSDNRLIQAKSARSAWTWAVDTGIITGTDSGRLEPNSPITRGEFAAILMRLCQS